MNFTGEFIISHTHNTATDEHRLILNSGSIITAKILSVEMLEITPMLGTSYTITGRCEATLYGQRCWKCADHEGKHSTGPDGHEWRFIKEQNETRT